VSDRFIILNTETGIKATDEELREFTQEYFDLTDQTMGVFGYGSGRSDPLRGFILEAMYQAARKTNDEEAHLRVVRFATMDGDTGGGPGYTNRT
jgi:hypothetical protein